MTDVQKEESQKTVISFVFGLLIGGLLVWAFMGGNGADTKDTEKQSEEKTETSANNESATTTDENPTETVSTLPTGDGKVTVSDKKAGRSVGISDTVYPIKEGWIGVREYRDGKLGYINGVIRFSDAGGVVPSTIPLVTPTIAGREYAVVMFTEGGVKGFNGADDKQLDTIFATFKAE